VVLRHALILVSIVQETCTAAAKIVLLIESSIFQVN